MSSGDELEEELREIRKLLRDYIDDSLERREQQRAENIQILVALGILGGFITLYVQDVVSNSPLEPFFWFIAMVSGGFLVLKTLISPLSIGADAGYLTKLDYKWSLYLYVFLILLSISTGIVLVAPLPTTEVPEIRDAELVLGIIGTISSLVITYYFRKTIDRASEERQEAEKRLRKTIKNFKEEDIIRLFLEYPQLLSYLLQKEIENIEAEPEFNGARPDLLAHGVDGDEIIIEIEYGRFGPSNTKRGVEQIQQYMKKYQSVYNNEMVGYLINVVGNEIFVSKLEDGTLIEQYPYEVEELVSEHPNVNLEQIIDF